MRYKQIVSIPADLKSRMDEVADQVNWSAIASKAFEKKLSKIAAKRNLTDEQLKKLKSLKKKKGVYVGKLLGLAVDSLIRNLSLDQVKD